MTSLDNFHVVKMLLTTWKLSSARKHGVSDEEILYVLDNALRLVEHEYGGEDRLLIIGPDRHGTLREGVTVPANSLVRIIHADVLRPSSYDYLR